MMIGISTSAAPGKTKAGFIKNCESDDMENVSVRNVLIEKCRAIFLLSGSVQNDGREDSTPHAEPEAQAPVFRILFRLVNHAVFQCTIGMT